MKVKKFFLYFLFISCIIPSISLAGNHTCCPCTHNHTFFSSWIKPIIKPVIYIGGAYVLIDHFFFDGKKTRELMRRFHQETKDEITHLQEKLAQSNQILASHAQRIAALEQGQQKTNNLLDKILAYLKIV